MKSTHGVIDLQKGYSFLWVTTPDGEVCGHVEAPDRSIVKGSYGFYRTTKPEEAAFTAAYNLKAGGVK